MISTNFGFTEKIKKKCEMLPADDWWKIYDEIRRGNGLQETLIPDLFVPKVNVKGLLLTLHYLFPCLINSRTDSIYHIINIMLIILLLWCECNELHFEA